MAKKRFVFWIGAAVMMALVLATLSRCIARRFREKREEACVENLKVNYRQALAITFLNSETNSEVKSKSAPLPGVRGELAAIEYIVRKLNCYYLPHPIATNGDIIPYPISQVPAPCNKRLSRAGIERFENFMKRPFIKEEVIDAATRVGRLAIRRVMHNYGKRDEAEWSFWGTGFLVGRGIVATPCHVVAPLLDENGGLNLPNGEKLFIDFAATGRPPGDEREFEVGGVTCSQKKGFDVALLDICSVHDGETTCPLGDPLAMFAGGFEEIPNKEESVLVGYADLDHFIDPDKRAAYDPWVPAAGQDPIYGKFVVGDIVASDDPCDKDIDIILDTDITTQGESGSPVIELPSNQDEGKKPMVIGMHTCCSAYFEYDQGKAPKPGKACARMRRTFHNQDISSRSILKDPTLCRVLKDRGAVQMDATGVKTPISCPGRN